MNILVVVVVAVCIGGLCLLLWRQRGDTVQPLRGVSGFFGIVLMLYVAWAGYFVYTAQAAGGQPDACVDTGYPSGTALTGAGVTARAGASLHGSGTVQACALHPTAGEWALYLLTRVPAVIVWALVLLLTWRLVSLAARSGPFSPAVAVVLRQLGWLITVGSAVAGALHQLGSDELTSFLMRPQVYSGSYVAADTLIFGPARAMFPVPVLAAAALLSFARIVGVGVTMDDELRATV
jgi:hypothetical protein